MSGDDHPHPLEFDEFVRTIRFDELCKVASRCRGGISCSLGQHIVGGMELLKYYIYITVTADDMDKLPFPSGFNAVYEVVFSDKTIWMARIPLPYDCFQPEEVSASYAATLKYLKKNSTIPIPEVFASSIKSDLDNKVNASYILMENLTGHELPVLEQENLEPDLEDVASAEKVHRQLVDVILQLGT